LKKSAADRTYTHIKQKILDGEYAPAQRLIECNLSQELGVGRHKIRSALEKLHADGLVEIEPNRGASVKSLELDEVVDILVAREALEAEVTSLAAAQITTDQLQQLSACLDTMQEALNSGEYDRYSARNKVFHQIIYDAAGNQTLPQLIVTLRQRLTRLQIRAILIPGRSESSIDEHKAILQALENRDADGADRAARAHIRSLRTAIQNAWQLIRV